MNTDFVEPTSLLETTIAYVRGIIPKIGLMLLASFVLLPFLFGYLTQNRDQAALINNFSAVTGLAAAAASTQDLSPLPAEPFAPGTASGYMSIPAIGLQQVIVEGTGADQTRKGPGHMAGTSGFGQTGNAVVIGRRLAYGGPFLRLNQLKAGDKIEISTIQGKSTYVVDPKLPALEAGALSASSDNRLTLVTSTPPIAAVGLTTVTASLVGKPFIDYPQAPSWTAVHPLGNTGHPLPVLALMVLSLVFVFEALRFVARTFTKSVTWMIGLPIVLATGIALSHVLDMLLPPSL